MKKRLILLRHGKSDWDQGFSLDHQRPLARRGIDAAKQMGRLLSASGQTPDLVVSSTAVRALTTAELAAEAGDWGIPSIVETGRLYDSTPQAVIAEIMMLPNVHETVMLVGHEPTWSETASLLIGGGRIRFATASMARIDFHVREWSDVGPGRGELIWHLQPKFFTAR